MKNRMVHTEDDRGSEFVELLTQHQRSLYGYIYTMIRNSSDSDDILQETNLVLWNKRNEYKLGTNFTAWACRIAYYKVQNYLRSKGRNRVCFSDKLLSKLSDLYINREEKHTIQTTMLIYCLEKLSSASQRLLKLCFDENHSIQEVAQQLGRPVGSIYNQLSQTRFILWKCIQRALKEEGA
jgi:RNA polymerase sigma-70 factor (ECF subfamily)